MSPLTGEVLPLDPRAEFPRAPSNPARSAAELATPADHHRLFYSHTRYIHTSVSYKIISFKILNYFQKRHLNPIHIRCAADTEQSQKVTLTHKLWSQNALLLLLLWPNVLQRNPNKQERAPLDHSLRLLHVTTHKRSYRVSTALDQDVQIQQVHQVLDTKGLKATRPGRTKVCSSVS